MLFGVIKNCPSCGACCRLHAVVKGKHEAAEILLQAGADVHATTQSGDTALHWAAYKVHLTRAGRLMSCPEV